MKPFLSIIVLLSIISFGINAQSVKSKKVSKSEFGKKWPLTANEGVIKCIDGIYVVFTAPDGKSYAVNGTALSKNTMKKRGWLDVWNIWKDDPELRGAKINISSLLNSGLVLCK